MSKRDLCLSGHVGGKHLVEYGQIKRVCVSCARHEKIAESKSSSKKVTFHLSDNDEESEGEDVEQILGGKKQRAPQSEAKSSFEKRQEKVTWWTVKKKRNIKMSSDERTLPKRRVELVENRMKSNRTMFSVSIVTNIK